MRKAKRQTNIIVIVTALLSLSLFIFFFNSYFKSTVLSFISSVYEVEIISETEFKESENLRILKLEEENNLRSQLDDIIEQYDNSRNEIDNLNIDLGDKQSEIDNLKSEIRNLLNVKHDLQEAKNKIVVLQNISKKYFAQVDSLLGLTEELQLQNKNLEEENILIKNQNQNLNSENTDLNARLDIGSILEVFEIEIDKLKYGSHGQERKVIWAKNIQFLRCCFKISANPIAKSEKKVVYIQYISPKGEILQSTSTPKESIFVYEEEIIQATTFAIFNYQNNELDLCIDWERGDVLEKGKYKIRIFIEGKFSGESSFTLN
tara:strand:- start:1682 stop:2638 length:957 start_codon:yes stop_codon:yes gene_type:complete